MTISEILNSVKFVVEPDGRQAAIIDMEVWEEIVALLEDTEDTEEIKQARATKEEPISWNDAKRMLGLGK